MGVLFGLVWKVVRGIFKSQSLEISNNNNQTRKTKKLQIPPQALELLL